MVWAFSLSLTEVLGENTPVEPGATHPQWMNQGYCKTFP